MTKMWIRQHLTTHENAVKRLKCPHNGHQKGIIDNIKVPQGVIEKPQMITRSNTKEEVKKHVQRDSEVSKERMLQQV